MAYHEAFPSWALKIILAWVGMFLLLGTGLVSAQEDGTRLYAASPMRLEAVVKEVLKEKTLTLHVLGYRPIMYLTGSPCSGGNGITSSRFSGGARTSSLNCFVTWIDLHYLKIDYKLAPKGEKETLLTFQFEPNTTSKALIRDLELLREDILGELHGQVSYRLPYYRE